MVTTTIVPSTSIWVYTYHSYCIVYDLQILNLCISNIINLKKIVIVIHNFKLDFNDSDLLIMPLETD